MLDLTTIFYAENLAPVKLEITSFPCKSSSPYLDLKSMLYA
jgi:hypothetical protein